MEKSSLLVVEDDQDLNEVICEIVGTAVPHVISAKDGKEALEKIRSDKSIRAILSDINMPNMSGIELLKALRSEFNPIPFVVLTAYGDPNTMRQAVQYNATDFLDKPFTDEELIEVIKKAMSYGEELAKIENDLDVHFKDATGADLELKKRLKRTALAMRVEKSIYIQGKK